MKHIKKTPYRTCVGCQQKKPKKELLRIIRTPDGIVEIDITGKKSGRGTYLCYNMSCFHEAVKKRRIDKALKVDLLPEKIVELEDRIKEVLSPYDDSNHSSLNGGHSV